MSTRQTGNGFENEAADKLEALDYWTFCARGSRTPVDVLAIHRGLGIIVAVQVGTANKGVAAAFRDLRAADAPPGTVRIVARRISRGMGYPVVWKWHYNSERNGHFPEPGAAIIYARKEAE